MPIEVRMPKLTQTMDEGKVVEWLKCEGDTVRRGEPLLVIETDKAAVEVEAPSDGILGALLLSAGDTAEVGALLTLIKAPGEIPTPPPIAQMRTEPPQLELSQMPSQISASRVKVRAMPAARRAAQELGVDLAQVDGTGPEGAIIEADVRRYAALRQPSSAAPQTEAPERTVRATPLARKLARELGVPLEACAGAGGRVSRAEVEEALHGTASAIIPGAADKTMPPAPSETGYRDEEPSRIGRSMADRMTASWTSAPHFYLETEVDMTEAGRLRENLGQRSTAGLKPSYTALTVLVVGRALRLHPKVNASFVNGMLRFLDEVNVGVAVASPEGLIVPVVRRADTKSLAEIARELEDLRGKAERLRFRPEELSGGTFTVSNLGMFGIDRFHAILNPPEAAILACGRILKRVIESEDGMFESRPMMSLVLSVDHRILDGATSASFLKTVREFLENPYLLL